MAFFEKVRRNLGLLRGQVYTDIVVYRGLSDKHHERVMREGFFPSPSEDRVYTTVKFAEAVRFAYSHILTEGGNPIVYELRVPLHRFQTQIFYDIDGLKPTGTLTSGYLEPVLIQDVIKIPLDPFEAGKLVDKKEGEEKAREAETRLALERIPREVW